MLLATMLSLQARQPRDKQGAPASAHRDLNVRAHAPARRDGGNEFPHSQREVEIDPLTWPSGLKRTRCRVAAEYWLGTQRIQKRLHEMNIRSSRLRANDPMTDPESSAMLFREAACEDKSLEWVDNVFRPDA